MQLRSTKRLYAVFAASLFIGGHASRAQQSTLPPTPAGRTKPTLADVARNLPDYIQPQTQMAYIDAFQNATAAERTAILPDIIGWLDDERPKVRGRALLSINLIGLPDEKHPESAYRNPLPVQYVSTVAAHLRDPDPSVRRVTFAALQSTEYSGVGLDQLVDLVVPMLRDPDVLTEYPDPFFIESDKQILAHMTPEQQAAFKAHPRKAIKLPATGPALLGILAMPNRHPSAAVDDAIIAFLDRDEQTKSTLADCLHTLALSTASERVNDEALTRVFERKAMTIFLLQFVADLRLTPAQHVAQRERLLALSNDDSAHPALRRSARDVAACWTGERTGSCKPNSKDLSEQLDTR